MANAMATDSPQQGKSMESSERAYWLRRAEQERGRAENAANGPARCAHQTLANAYAARAGSAVAAMPAGRE